MQYQCTQDTDLDDLIGHDEADGFHSGPLYKAMTRDEPLELIGSGLLSRIVRARLDCLCHGFLVAETGERIEAPSHFGVVYH